MRTIEEIFALQIMKKRNYKKQFKKSFKIFTKIGI